MITSNSLENGLVIINFIDKAPDLKELEKYFTIPFILESQEIKDSKVILKLFFCGYEKKNQEDNKEDKEYHNCLENE